MEARASTARSLAKSPSREIRSWREEVDKRRGRRVAREVTSRAEERKRRFGRGESLRAIEKEAREEREREREREISYRVKREGAVGIYKDVRDNANGDRGARQGVRPAAEDARQVHRRVRLQVLPETLHETLQPHDTRAQSQGWRDIHVRGLRKIIQKTGQPQAAQVPFFLFSKNYFFTIFNTPKTKRLKIPNNPSSRHPRILLRFLKREISYFSSKFFRDKRKCLYSKWQWVCREKSCRRQSRNCRTAASRVSSSMTMNSTKDSRLNVKLAKFRKLTAYFSCKIPLLALSA